MRSQHKEEKLKNYSPPVVPTAEELKEMALRKKASLTDSAEEISPNDNTCDAGSSSSSSDCPNNFVKTVDSSNSMNLDQITTNINNSNLNNTLLSAPIEHTNIVDNNNETVIPTLVLNYPIPIPPPHPEPNSMSLDRVLAEAVSVIHNDYLDGTYNPHSEHRHF